MKTTAERVIALIAEEASCAIEQAGEDKYLAYDLGLDSLDRYELTMDLEDEFGIEITDTEGAACNTVGEVVALAERKVKERQS